MTDYGALKAEILSSGMTMTSIAVRSGIPRVTLYNRMRGIGEFKASEIDGLTKTLRLSKAQRDAIFFAK